MSKWLVWGVWLVYLLACPCSADAGFWKKKKKGKAEVKVELSEYDKLFKGKRYETAISEFMAVHKMDGKVYLEYPLRLMGRELLLASTTTVSTDNTVCTNGYKENTPLHIRFTLENGMVQLRKVNAWIAADGDKEKMEQIIRQNYRDPVVAAYKVLAYTPDSLAVVFEMTGMFLNEEPQLSPIPDESGGMKVTASYNGNLSSVLELKAFEDNVSVKSRLMYNYSVTYDRMALVKDQPLNVEVTRTLLLLPEKRMRPRISDLRLGVFLTQKRYLSDRGEEVRKCTYANRWRLEPKDIKAWERGELVEPVKPIVWYVDDAFPDEWREPIKAGVLIWNQAFEKIGFKNAIQVRDFPVNDPSFDPDNLKYSCLRYLPTPDANAMGPSWVDPRNSEIIQASVFIYHDVIQLVNDMRFVQTSQVDPRVRTTKLPEDVLEESMRYIVAHEVGHCLGLMHNMASSASIPVEKYRDKEFMEKYGTTPSIMDYARFNYIAQPEDKGVKLTPPRLGVYDFYAIDWGYRFFPDAKSTEEEVPHLNKIIEDKIGDPMYRYGKQQIYYGVFDPTSLTEDLGDDAVKAGEYGIKNLKYIMSHLNEWLDGQDADYSYRFHIYQAIASQYMRYLYNVNMNIGGFYINEHMVGDPYATSAIVPKEMQKRSAQFLFEQLKDMDWIDNIDVVKNLPLDGSTARLMLKNLAGSLLNTKRLSLAVYRDKDAYSPEEYLTDLYESIWASAIKGTNPTECERILQTEVLKNLIKGADPLTPRGEVDELLAAEMNRDVHALSPRADLPVYQQMELFEHLRDMPVVSGNFQGDMLDYYHSLNQMNELNERAGFDYIYYVFNTSTNNNNYLYYQLLTKVKAVMEKRKNSGSYETRAHYTYLLSIVEDFMKSK